MNTKEIEKNLIDITCSQSHFDETRNYVGISGISDTVENLISYYKNGHAKKLEASSLLKFYKGYQMEKDLIRRLKLIYGERIVAPIELTQGIFGGHPDCSFDGIICDVKSYLMDEWIPRFNENLPRRIYWQMQGYMLFSDTDTSLLISESRENGVIQVREVRRNESIIMDIEAKMRQIESELKVNI